MQLTRLFKDFTNNEQASGIVLISCTLASLAAANLIPGYGDLWHFPLGAHTVTHWINDGLMTIFFLLIGLELEREVYQGELSTPRQAALPAIAALGGMVVPALFYWLINMRSGNISGVGIPMATDIAFALAVLHLVGNRIPVSLKVFLTALAVIDDLGAILVIAIFYTSSLHWLSLSLALGTWTFLFGLNRLKVHQAWPYLLGGVVMWYFMLGSGIHATITGVILAFVIPFGSGDEQSLSYRLQKFLHKPVAFGILPLFALANTSILIGEDFYHGLTSAVSIGVITGLFIGKPVGVFLFTYVSVKIRLSHLSPDINWKHIFGTGILAGIGFTMSIFISLLAFTDTARINHAKIAVLIASFFSGIIGFLYLKAVVRSSGKNLLVSQQKK